jgi:histidyl-tRNA synthetase
MESEAHSIAAHLRRSGLRVFTSFRGNSKKQSEKAKQLGVSSILYIRDDERPERRLHLTNVKLDGDPAMDQLLDITTRLPEPYRQVSGDDQV